jgi:hypothetical protein
MTSPSREHLLGYLLGALERTEQEQIEAELDQNPTLRAELERVQSCLGHIGLSDKPQDFDPPPGLAARACRHVVAHARSTPTPATSVAAQFGGEQARRFRWADLLAISAVLMIGASLIFPALWNSHLSAQIASCESNLLKLGTALHDFSNRQPDGNFPGPEASGARAAAGIYAPTLVSYQHVPAKLFLCPSSPLVRSGSEFRVPTLDELDKATGQKLVALQQSMGGDYGYTLGYTQDGKLQKPCNSRRPGFALLADAPSDTQPGRVSANHRGRGQNLLYEDGHVQFLMKLPSPDLTDDPFHNRDGRVAAGLDCDDAVLGTSSDPPFPATLISNPGR